MFLVLARLGALPTQAVCEIYRTRSCRRCGKLEVKQMATAHVWSTWEAYDFTRPRRELEGVKAPEVTVTHQRRRCRRCGVLEDVFMRYGPLGPPLPGLMTAEPEAQTTGDSSEGASK